MVNVNVTGGKLPQKEINAYIMRAKENNPTKEVVGVDIAVDGDYVDLTYHFKPIHFDRIRRITGYLVGTTERFNNAKRAEERDRVKHDLTGIAGMEQI